ncbi:MAG: type restriction enzyme, partial [Campylobacterota bacterium]|nr:type restriction enzyme [Campylobacterota bacterium]
LKENFKNSKLYQEGFIYTNTWEEFIPDKLTMEFYLGKEWRQWYIDIDNNSDEYKLLQKQNDDWSQKDEICFINEDKFYMRHLVNIMGFSFSYLQSKLPALKSVDEFITNKKYLGGIKIIPSSTREIDFITKQKLILQILSELEYQFENRSIYYGVNYFSPQPIYMLKDNKTLSQSEEPIEENGDWFAYEKVYADSSYESKFVAYIKSIMPKLKASYEDVKLIRNVEQYTFYHKETGGGFQPDFFLMLHKENCTYQILCEAKGEDRADGDRWKEDLMGWITELTDNKSMELNNLYGEDTTTPCQIGCYKLYGTKFYQPNTQGIFDKSLNDVISYR